MMEIRLAILIITQVAAAFETIKHIFKIDDKDNNHDMIEINGCLCPSVSDDYILFCVESDLCEYLAGMAVKRFSDIYDPEFFEKFVFENVDQKMFEEAEKSIISHLNLTDEEIEKAPVLIQRFL